jgi:hypothetical protein
MMSFIPPGLPKKGKPLKGFRLSARSYMLFGIVILFALYANLRIINKETERLQGPGRMEEILYEARLEPLKKVLPKDAIVGYVTDESVDALHKINYFYLTQYDLCPVLTVKGTHYPFIIGGYYGIGNPGGPETAGLVLVKDFGYGVQLYRGKQK